MESEEEKKRKEGAFYEIRWSEGAAAADPFVPRPEAFAALTILFAVLSSSVWCGRRDNRSAVRKRRNPSFLRDGFLCSDYDGRDGGGRVRSALDS